LRAANFAKPFYGRPPSPTAWLELELEEGKNRQVRRMTATIGHPTLRLIRWVVGPWTLDGLSPGQWRETEAPE
jgi:23S rRNA pseudouridine2457 synthase